MDSYSAADRRDDDDADGTEVASSAVVLGSMTAGNMESREVGPLSAGIAGIVAANDLTESENFQEEDKLNLDALEPFGSKQRETADDGVSEPQREAESDELNG